MANRNTKDCQKAPPGTPSSSTSSTNSQNCDHCTQQGHLKRDFRTKKPALELRKGASTSKKAINTINPEFATTNAPITAATTATPTSSKTRKCKRRGAFNN